MTGVPFAGPRRAWASPSTALVWWLAALAYYLAGCLLHLQFSLWLVRQRVTSIGPLAYADAMPWLVVAGAAGLLVWFVSRLKTSPRPRRTIGFWLIWLTAVALIDRLLIYSINEYAHYPQYALLAWLIARAMDPTRTQWYVGRVLFWTTLMGMGDELLQYLWITNTYSDYLDFNDFLMNLVAAAAGTLLYYGAAARPAAPSRRRPPVVELVAATTLTLAVGAGLLADRVVQTPSEKILPGGIVRRIDGSRQLYLQRSPHFYGAWQASQRHASYYVLPPAAGLALLVAAGALFASFGRNRVKKLKLRGYPCASARHRSKRFQRAAAFHAALPSSQGSATALWVV